MLKIIPILNMKKLLKITIIVIAVLALAFFGLKKYTKGHSPQETLVQKEYGLSLSYSKPSMKGRKIFGELVPFGKVWRTGANEATIITFEKDITVGEKPVKAGSYSLWTIPNQDSWTVILNSETGQWGTNYDASKDVVKFNVAPIKMDATVEQFTAQFMEADLLVHLLLKWENTAIIIPIQ